jgi:hypothetical protein
VLNGESEGAWGLIMGDESNYGVVAAVSGSFEGRWALNCCGASLFHQFVYDLDRTCLVACYLMTSPPVRQVLESIMTEQKHFPCIFPCIFSSVT